MTSSRLLQASMKVSHPVSTITSYYIPLTNYHKIRTVNAPCLQRSVLGCIQPRATLTSSSVLRQDDIGNDRNAPHHKFGNGGGNGTHGRSSDRVRRNNWDIDTVLSNTGTATERFERFHHKKRRKGLSLALCCRGLGNDGPVRNNQYVASRTCADKIFRKPEQCYAGWSRPNTIAAGTFGLAQCNSAGQLRRVERPKSDPHDQH